MDKGLAGPYTPPAPEQRVCRCTAGNWRGEAGEAGGPCSHPGQAGTAGALPSRQRPGTPVRATRGHLLRRRALPRLPAPHPRAPGGGAGTCRGPVGQPGHLRSLGAGPRSPPPLPPEPWAPPGAARALSSPGSLAEALSTGGPSSSPSLGSLAVGPRSQAAPPRQALEAAAVPAEPGVRGDVSSSPCPPPGRFSALGGCRSSGVQTGAARPPGPPGPKPPSRPPGPTHVGTSRCRGSRARASPRATNVTPSHTPPIARPLGAQKGARWVSFQLILLIFWNPIHTQTQDSLIAGVFCFFFFPALYLYFHFSVFPQLLAPNVNYPFLLKFKLDGPEGINTEKGHGVRRPRDQKNVS